MLARLYDIEQGKMTISEPKLHLGRRVRLRETPEQAARRADLRRPDRQGVVKSGCRRARPRGGVARGTYRRHAVLGAAQDRGHGGGGAVEATVVVRQRSRLQNAGEHPLGNPGQGGVARGRRGARPGRDEWMLGHLEGADHDGLGTVVPGRRDRRNKKVERNGRGREEIHRVSGVAQVLALIVLIVETKQREARHSLGAMFPLVACHARVRNTNSLFK